MPAILTSCRQLFRRRSIAVVAIASSCALLCGATAAVAYDRHHASRLLPGTVIAGEDVSGLTAAEATKVLSNKVEAPLHRPIRVRAPGLDRVTTAWDLGLRVDVRATVDEALIQVRDEQLAVRVFRRVLRSGSQRVALAPELDPSMLHEFLAEASRTVKVEPVNATMSTTNGWLTFGSAQMGRQLDEAAAADNLRRAMSTGANELDLPVAVVAPEVGSSAFGTVVLVRAGENKLYLYKDGQISRTYDVATGDPSHETPKGRFVIERKRRNPTWINPDSAWSKKMPASIKPGPDNPLGSRAMDLNVSGIRIHGTPNANSIGLSVSHGCVRMLMSDAEDLFERVDVGTQVVIIQAGAPRVSRPAPTAAPAAAPTVA